MSQLLALVWPTLVWPGPPMQMQMLGLSQNQPKLLANHGDKERRRTSCLPLLATPGILPGIPFAPRSNG